MTAALLLSIGAGAPPLADDLRAVGLEPLPPTDCDGLVRDALRLGPDIVVGWVAQPDEALWRALELLVATSPKPIAIFTQDPCAESIERAVGIGVQEWVVRGYARERLRSVVQVATTRFNHERKWRERHDELQRRFEERKLVDRAKGLLMRASQMSEEEAFNFLRTASMQGNERVGQLSRRVIDAARTAESINRAGQLRMLSQRAVKLLALARYADEAPRALPLLVATLERADANLSALGRLLSRPTWGDLLDGLVDGWKAVRAAQGTPASSLDLQAVDDAAQTCIERADRLVDALQAAGAAPTLHVVNLSGRQRMLSQRVAKQALLALALDRGERVDAAAVAEFERSHALLQQLPLSTREIRETLDTARHTWSALLAGVRQVESAGGRRAIAASSEALLELLERLTERYERSMQMLVG